MTEPQYDDCFEQDPTDIGYMLSDVYRNDPCRLAFVLSHYKFVAKMLAGKEMVAEIGCGDGFPSGLVRSTVGELVLYDFDNRFVGEALMRGFPAFRHDIIEGPLPRRYDAIYSLDVVEHIVDHERVYKNVVVSLAPHGVFIVGMPSLESQAHASPKSKTGHVSCMSGSDLKRELEGVFHNVFLFSFNDEVLHTGFYPMAHYLMAVCCEPKEI